MFTPQELSEVAKREPYLNVTLGGFEVLVLHTQLCLALKHPCSGGPTGIITTQIVDAIEASVSPDLSKALAYLRRQSHSTPPTVI